MNLTIGQLKKLSQQQRKKLKYGYKNRNCKHNFTTWGKCDKCKKIVDIERREEYKRVHPHIFFPENINKV